MPTTDRTPASPARRPARRRWLGLAVVLALVVAVVVAGLAAFRTVTQTLFVPGCDATASGSTVSFSPEQTANAALISAVSVKRGLPPRAATIALATAIQESKLRNLTVGDRDSLGLFQQRPSQGWGTREQILDPVYATNAFYDALVKVKGYESMPITVVAQQVQRSAFPEAYADHEQEGRVLASTLTGRSPAGLVCRLRPAQQVVAGRDVVADLAAQLGVTAAAGGSQVTLTGPDAEGVWAAGHWAVARAEAYGIDRVQVGDRVWQRGDGDSAKTWSVPATAAAPSAVTIRLATSATG